MEFITLGTSHGATVPGRSCSGNLLRVNGVNYLFDCGGNVEGKMTDLDIPIKDIKCVFVSHMHEDHAGTLTSVVKRFCIYQKNEKVKIFLTEQNAIDAFKVWASALHIPLSDDKAELDLVSKGKIYSDENISVTAIPTKHINNGLFPSYAYMVEAEGKKILYTGDLAIDFQDYPKILFEEEFEFVVCELVHFDLEKSLDLILKTNTKKLIFTHVDPTKALKIIKIKESFPFSVEVAEDGKAFGI